MSATYMLETAGFLGLFVLFAFGYGLLYGLGQLRCRRGLVVMGFASYGLQCVVVAAVVLFTPLRASWTGFVALSCALYLAIPPITWRYLAALHRLEGQEP